MGKNECFFLATTLLGEVGTRRDEPKAEQKILLRRRVLRNNNIAGRAFSHSPKFFCPPLYRLKDVNRI